MPENVYSHFRYRSLPHCRILSPNKGWGKNKKFDFSVIGGPHYSSDTKFGLGLVAAGLYRTDSADTILPPSNVSLYGDVSTVGFYLLGVRGNHLFPQDK